MEPDFEIEYRATKQLIIHDLHYISKEEFLGNHTFSNDYGTIAHRVCWCEGILWLPFWFESSELIQKDWLQGIMHLAYIEYAVMPQYEPFLSNAINNVKLPIQKVEAERWVKIIKWIKENGPKQIIVPEVLDNK